MFREKGGRVYYDGPYCDKYTSALGLASNRGIIDICVSRHRSVSSLADTVRHEVWHIAQFCKGGPIGNQPINQIVAAHSVGWTGRGYEAKDYHIEAEAHYVAATQDEQFVARGFRRFCLS